MILTVVDTNVLVSAAIAPGSMPSRAVELAISRGRLVVSRLTYAEFVIVLSRDKFERYASRSSRMSFLLGLESALHMIEPAVVVQSCRDSDDDKFLALAISAGAEHLITGDDDLLILHPFGSVQILKPADHLQLA